jgi:hypothetical protein
VVLAASTGNIFMQETLDYVRYLIVTPFIPILIAVGLRYSVPMLWPSATRPASRAVRRAGRAVVPLVAVGIALWQVVYYFGPFRVEYAVSLRAGHAAPDPQDAVLRVAELPTGDQLQVIIVTRTGQDLWVARALNGFLSRTPYPLEVVDSNLFTPDYLAALPRDRGYAFFLEPADSDSYRRLAEAFPLGSPLYSTDPLIPVTEAYIGFVVPPPPGAG